MVPATQRDPPIPALGVVKAPAAGGRFAGAKTAGPCESRANDGEHLLQGRHRRTHKVHPVGNRRLERKTRTTGDNHVGG